MSEVGATNDFLCWISVLECEVQCLMNKGQGLLGVGIEDLDRRRYQQGLNLEEQVRLMSQEAAYDAKMLPGSRYRAPLALNLSKRQMKPHGVRNSATCVNELPDPRDLSRC
jgi:hypothetical protein